MGVRTNGSYSRPQRRPVQSGEELRNDDMVRPRRWLRANATIKVYSVQEGRDDIRSSSATGAIRRARYTEKFVNLSVPARALRGRRRTSWETAYPSAPSRDPGRQRTNSKAPRTPSACAAARRALSRNARALGDGRQGHPLQPDARQDRHRGIHHRVVLDVQQRERRGVRPERVLGAVRYLLFVVTDSASPPPRRRSARTPSRRWATQVTMLTASVAQASSTPSSPRTTSSTCRRRSRRTSAAS